MANPYSRNERPNPYGRDRSEGAYNRERGDFRRQRSDYPDWDRNGSYRDVGRAQYSQGDRENWQTDDLGYGDSTYSESPYRRGYPDYFEDRERGYARQRTFDDRQYARDDRQYARDDRQYGRRRDFVDRASDEVASWFGDEDAERRREMDKHRGKGPKGYIRTDERIQDDVNDRLSDDPMLDATDIEVTVSGGEVTLNGFVATRQDKRRAEDIVDAISGVNNVQNNLRVKPNEEITNIVS